MDPNDIYYCSLYNQGRGHPLFIPEPDDNIPVALQNIGIGIGDLGVWNIDGSFDVLFNVCQPATHVANRHGVPESFEPLTLRDKDLLKQTSDLPRSAITSTNVEKANIEGGFSFSSFSRGGVLVLPEGASRVDWIQSRDDVRKFISQNYEKWHSFVNTDRGRRTSSLFIVTGCDKTTAWGLASFLGSSESGTLSLTCSDLNEPEAKWSYEWEGCTPAAVRFSANRAPLMENQCIFLRGFTLSLRTSEVDQDYEDDEVAQPYNTPVIINNWLLDITPEAFVAVTHDDDWRDILKEADQIPPEDQELLRRVREKYKPMTVSGVVFLAPRQTKQDNQVPLTHSPSPGERTYSPRRGACKNVAASGQFVETFTSASAISDNVWEALKAKPRDSNIILPHALKSLAEEKSGELPASNQVWIACSSHNPRTVDLVLSCTEGPMGSYPIFIFSTRPFASLTHEYLLPRLVALARKLREAVPIKRVYSVFAPEPITQLFASLWTEATGVEGYTDEPYYAAKLSYCTKRSIVNRQTIVHADLVYDLRPAIDDDILDVAELCYDFAAASDPFVLTSDAAIEEATILVRKKQVWVHRVCQPGGTGGEIASIVAFTRNTDTVSTITKVYTNPKWRNRDCAERLIRHVCKHLLLTAESVVIYVARDNPGLTKVLDHVGFIGLSPNSSSVDGVDAWLELGFDRTKVQLGHW